MSEASGPRDVSKYGFDRVFSVAGAANDKQFYDIPTVIFYIIKKTPIIPPSALPKGGWNGQITTLRHAAFTTEIQDYRPA